MGSRYFFTSSSENFFSKLSVMVGFIFSVFNYVFSFSPNGFSRLSNSDFSELLNQRVSLNTSLLKAILIILILNSSGNSPIINNAIICVI